MKKYVSLALSIVMVLTVILSLPFSTQAANDTGLIMFRDEFGAWGVDDYDKNDIGDFLLYKGEQVDEFETEPVNGYKGISYDEKSNTLTLDNVKQILNAYFVSITDMGDLKIKLIGTSALIRIDIYNTNVTFTGNGTLNFNPKMSWTRGKYTEDEWDDETHVNERILDCPVYCANSTFAVTSGATVNVYNSSEESPTMEFDFSEAKTNAQLNSAVLTYGKITTAPAVWDSEITSDYEYASAPYIKHVIPATKLMYLKGSDMQNNIWISSVRDSGTVFDRSMSPLILNADGMWVEDFAHGYKYSNYDGKWFARDGEYAYDYNNPPGDLEFAEYTDTSSLPMEITNGNVTIYVNGAYPWASYMRCYSDSNAFAMRYFNKTDWVYEDLTPVEPASASDYGHEMFYMQKQGETEYFEYCENIIANEYVNDDTAVAEAEKMGYTFPRIYTYKYYLMNNPVSFTSDAQQINLSTCTITGVVDKTYTGKALTQSITVKNGAATLKNGTDYTVSYKNNTNVGTATVTVTGKGNYTGSKSVTFKIGAQSIASSTVNGATEKTYNGKAQTQSITVNCGSATLKNGTDYTVAYKNNTKAGTATLTVTGKGNYTGTKSLTFKIKTQTLKNCTISGVKTQTYTGKAITQSITVKSGSTTLKSGTDYTVAYKNNIKAGEATLTVTGKGNYSGSKSVRFKINAKDVIAKCTVSGVKDKTYTGNAITQSIKVVSDSTTLKCGTDYTVTYKNNKDVGKATITITGKGNYSGTKKVTFIINPKGTSVSKVTSTKKAQLKVSVKKQTGGTTGYEIQYSLKSNFSAAKSAIISSNKTTEKTFTKLITGKKYYVRVRTYKTVSGKKYYSEWNKYGKAVKVK